MKNITVSVPDEVYRQARVHAAQTGTSVSRMVARYLHSLSDRGPDVQEAAAAREEIAARVTGYSASQRLTRDEVHDRATLR